ncbi:BlaI/MecI/CopY family transcriptional regulator [Bradyrhizobium sp.]|uniref:BlaI/MecI/CopY family transcriptional regulator n=1 Tax=Bradyrhizobium sp. TaxID=376 RepID=UPI0039E709C6
MDIQFTDREAEVMEVLWERGPSLVAEVRDALKDDFAYTTVLTVLRMLESKGYVGHEQEGRGHRYFATVKQQAAQKSALRHLTRKLFKGSSELLFTRLVSDQKLSAEQIRKLRKLLADKSGEED